jgi:glycosyltransferase involved in cell wall biosynthesis
MRIGYDTLIENPFRPSSAINYIKSVLRALVQVGPEHEYFVFVSPRNRHHFEFNAPNVHLLNCGFSNENIPMRVLAQQLYLPILARRHRLDVIHAINQIPRWSPCATVVKTCGLHHHLLPGEYLREASSFSWTNPLRLVYRRLMWDSSARRATRVMANSEVTRDDIMRLMGVASSRIQVVYEAVDDGFGGGLDALEARTAIWKAFDLEREYVLYVSNLWFYKNPDGAIRAFARQREKFGDDLDLLIVGPDDYQRTPALRSLAAECQVADRVRFLGKVDYHQLLQLYAGARVMLYPSLAETFGKPVVEAMRSRVPVVAARATCLPEIVGDAGLLVDPADIEGMAEALHSASADDCLRQDLIARGVRRAQRFSWSDTARGTLQMCLDAVAQHRTRTGVVAG